MLAGSKSVIQVSSRPYYCSKNLYCSYFSVLLSHVVLIAYLMISRTIVETYTNCWCKMSIDFIIISESVLFVFSY